jgi:hypothetical protein
MTVRVQPNEAVTASFTKSALRTGLSRNSSVHLLAVLALLFLASPFLDDLPGGDLIEAMLLSGVMVSSVLAVGGRRRSLIVALLLIAPSLAGKWFSHFSPSLLASLIYLIAGMAFFGFVVGSFVRFILSARQVNANVLCSGLSGYLLLGMLWVPAYVMVARLNPDAFNLPAAKGSAATMTGFNAFYFSFMTLSTVGYGDITPVSKGARMLAVLEAIAGLFYVAVLISRLVAIYTSNQSRSNPDADYGK